MYKFTPDLPGDFGLIQGTPTIGYKNRVFTATSTGGTYCIDSSTGVKIWSAQGVPWAVDPALGVSLWQLFSPDAPVYATINSAIVHAPNQPYVITVDNDYNVICRHAEDGSIIWEKHKYGPGAISDHPATGMLGQSVLAVGDTLYVGIASLDLYGYIFQIIGFTDYETGKHRGGIVALDINTGVEKFRTYFVPPSAPYHPNLQALLANGTNNGWGGVTNQGPSGCDVWAPIAYDKVNDSIIVGTGQNNTTDSLNGTNQTNMWLATSMSDSVVALNAKTGAIKWHHQMQAGDVWMNGTTNTTNGKPFYQGDCDVSSVMVYELPSTTGKSKNCRAVIGASCKNGIFAVLDAKTGAVINQRQVNIQPFHWGALQNGAVVADGRVFVHGGDLRADIFSNPREDGNPYDVNSIYSSPNLEPAYEGTVVALSLDGSQELWRRTFENVKNLGPMAHTNGVLFFTLPDPGLITAERSSSSIEQPPKGKYRVLGLDAETGDTLFEVSSVGNLLTGPMIAEGKLFHGQGQSFVDPLSFDGGLLCYSLQKK